MVMRDNNRHHEKTLLGLLDIIMLLLSFIHLIQHPVDIQKKMNRPAVYSYLSRDTYWYPLGQGKVILHDSIMTFVS